MVKLQDSTEFENEYDDYGYDQEGHEDLGHDDYDGYDGYDDYDEEGFTEYDDSDFEEEEYDEPWYIKYKWYMVGLGAVLLLLILIGLFSPKAPEETPNEVSSDLVVPESTSESSVASISSMPESSKAPEPKVYDYKVPEEKADVTADEGAFKAVYNRTTQIETDKESRAEAYNYVMDQLTIIDKAVKENSQNVQLKLTNREAVDRLASLYGAGFVPKADTFLTYKTKDNSQDQVQFIMTFVKPETEETSETTVAMYGVYNKVTQNFTIDTLVGELD